MGLDMSSVKKIVLMESDDIVRNKVQAFLKKRNYAVYEANTINRILELLTEENISIVLLATPSCNYSGEKLCSVIRQKSTTPIILMAELSTEDEVLEAFCNGADDYIMKPLRLKILLARIEAILRRTEPDFNWKGQGSFGNNGPFFVDPSKQIIKKKEQEISLTSKEYFILVTLINNPNKVFTREELICDALGVNYKGFDRTIDSHIKNLRKKIEDNPKSPKYIKTIHGVGYKFENRAE
jgi:Response regulators consisting of a CheY-like receiver domain and a winged-helix DNA-binding domain